MPSFAQEDFLQYLVEIDELFAEYFRNRHDDIRSIVQCFGPLQEGKLLYFSGSKLDPYIRRIIMEKHQELFGRESVVETVL